MAEGAAAVRGRCQSGEETMLCREDAIKSVVSTVKGGDEPLRIGERRLSFATQEKFPEATRLQRFCPGLFQNIHSRQSTTEQQDRPAAQQKTHYRTQSPMRYTNSEEIPCQSDKQASGDIQATQAARADTIAKSHDTHSRRHGYYAIPLWCHPCPSEHCHQRHDGV